MLNYALKHDNLWASFIIDCLEVFPGIYGKNYNKFASHNPKILANRTLINEKICRISHSKKLKLAFAKGYGCAICKDVEYKDLKELHKSNFTIALDLNEKTKEFESCASFFVLSDDKIDLIEGIRKPIFLSTFTHDLTLAKIANEKNLAGVVVQGLQNIEEIKSKFPNLEIICEVPSNKEKALENAKAIIDNKYHLKNKYED